MSARRRMTTFKSAKTPRKERHKKKNPSKKNDNSQEHQVKEHNINALTCI
jgi:hypothetical protein